MSMAPVAPMGCPSAMAPAVDVDLLAVDVQVADELLDDDGERLVDLEEVDVVERQAGPVEHLAGRRDRGRSASASGRRPRWPVATTRARGVRPWACGVVGAGEEDRRRAVDHARGVAGVVHVARCRGPG